MFSRGTNVNVRDFRSIDTALLAARLVVTAGAVAQLAIAFVF